MIKIVDIYKLGSLCPTQWYGKDEATGLWVYFRYRFGRLTACWTISRAQISNILFGDVYDGYLNFEQLKNLLKGEIEFACEERSPTNEELGSHY